MLPLVLCAVFVVLGIVLIVAGDPVVGLMSVLFFGVGGLALLLPLLPRKAAGARVVDAGGERGLLFPFGRAKRIVVVIAAAGMAGASALLVAVGQSVVGTIGLVLFGGLAIYSAVTLRREQGLVLTPTRIVVWGPGGGELPWDAVADVALIEYSRTLQLGIWATDSRLVRRSALGRVNAKLAPADLSVAADHLAGAPEQALSTLVTYLEDPRCRAAIGTQAELERLS